MAKKRGVKIEIPKLQIKRMKLKLVGDSPLIVHKWSDKAKSAILDKQTQKAKQAKGARKPEEEYKACFYKTKNGKYGMLAIAFKLAAVRAATDCGMKMTDARRAFFVHGDSNDKSLAILKGPAPTMREDTVRIGMGSGDLRYRPQFWPWSCTITVEYNTSVISAEQVTNLLNTAGFGVGVGDWRVSAPKSTGQFGRFHVG